MTGITPSAIDLATPPASFTITGGGFTNPGFGLPVVNFMLNGAALGAGAGDGDDRDDPDGAVPDERPRRCPGNGNLPGLSAGAITVEVWLQTGASTFSLLGSTALTVTDTRSTGVPGVTGITPSAIDLATPPATFTITGGGFTNSGFGLPVVNFMRNGAALGQARATATTGTTLTVPYPTSATALPGNGNLPGLSAGAVTVDVWLQTGASTFSLLGSTALTVTDTRPAPGVTGITPNPIALAAPPATFTITGGGFTNSGFGLPVVNFMRNGAALGQARATAMTGTTLTVPYPTQRHGARAQSPRAVGGGGDGGRVAADGGLDL